MLLPGIDIGTSSVKVSVVDASMFWPQRSFTIGALVIVSMLTVLYTIYW